MSTPGFDPETVDEIGCPVWINELAPDDPNHLVHVVRDLEPARALELLGADRQSISSCELPAERPDEHTSLPGAAIAALNPMAVLLAGRVGDWTFVYDDLGYTLGFLKTADPALETAQVLSGEGAAAATGYVTITGQAGFVYAVGGELLTNASAVFELSDLPEDARAEARAAFESAGSCDPEFDDYLGIRAVCALAGLPCGLEAIRELPLLVAPLD